VQVIVQQLLCGITTRGPRLLRTVNWLLPPRAVVIAIVHGPWMVDSWIPRRSCKSQRLRAGRRPGLDPSRSSSVVRAVRGGEVIPCVAPPAVVGWRRDVRTELPDLDGWWLDVLVLPSVVGSASHGSHSPAATCTSYSDQSRLSLGAGVLEWNGCSHYWFSTTTTHARNGFHLHKFLPNLFIHSFISWVTVMRKRCVACTAI
jgi:hypothetical protein